MCDCFNARVAGASETVPGFDGYLVLTKTNVHIFARLYTDFGLFTIDEQIGAKLTILTIEVC